MARRTTIDALPDDMLHEIFGLVFASEASWPVISASLPPVGTHLALRCVCRRWRDIADWARVSTSTMRVDTSTLADVDAVRARHPAAFKSLWLSCPPGAHSTSIPRAAASLINGSADLRRGLLCLQLHTCCLPSLSQAVTSIASCTALNKLALQWGPQPSECMVVPSNVLAPLSALRMLGTLVYGLAAFGPASALLAPLPALPDAPRLTCLHLITTGNFVPVGSDAALGRLRRLEFEHPLPVQELVDADDPFLLRAALDAGTWQPSRLTGLKELYLTLGRVRGDLRAAARPSPTGFPSGSEWAPLAGLVTSLTVRIEPGVYRRPSTGIVAGLGALTALRKLRVTGNFANPAEVPVPFEPVSLDRVRAPHLTRVDVSCVSTPVNVAQFPNLVHLNLASITRQPPLNLRSLVARSSLKRLYLGICVLSPGSINLAELFAMGDGWPVLERLQLKNALLEWDATVVAGAPTAAEFAERAWQLLPILFDVTIDEPVGAGTLVSLARVGFVAACREHVVPALLGLDLGGD